MPVSPYKILYSYVALVPAPSCIWQYKFVHKFAGTLDTAINKLEPLDNQSAKAQHSSAIPASGARPSLPDQFLTQEVEMGKGRHIGFARQEWLLACACAGGV